MHFPESNNEQGPTVTACRVTMLLMKETSITHIGMVGICGGRTLGQVIIGTRAISQADGHVEKPKDQSSFRDNVDLRSCTQVIHRQLKQEQEAAAGKYFFAHARKKDNPKAFKYASEVDEDVRHMVGEFIQTEKDRRPESAPNVVCGTFLSYPQVRDDVEFELPLPCLGDPFAGNESESIYGLEMEAHALLYATTVVRRTGRSIKSLPVIKAVSDVSDVARDNRLDRTVFPWVSIERVHANSEILRQGGGGGDNHNHRDLRKKFRSVASRRAAETYYKLLDFYLKTRWSDSI